MEIPASTALAKNARSAQRGKHKNATYIVRLGLQTVSILLLLSIFVFGIVHLIP